MLELAIKEIPSFVDTIVVVDDKSTDDTWNLIQTLAKKDKRIAPIKHEINTGIGGAYLSGFEFVLKRGDVDLVFTMAGDAQCNTNYMTQMIDTLLDNNLDYVKANRFVHLDALKKMPTFRRIGNIVITILTKFSSGYYNIFDSQNGYGVFQIETLKSLDFSAIGKRYDYENTLLIALAIIDARIKDQAVPAIYGDEESTIPVFKTSLRALNVVWKGFWKRLYRKYIVVNFHPIALFFLTGFGLGLFGLVFGAFLVIERLSSGQSPSSGSVLLAAIPLILGLQLSLTAITMDMNRDSTK